LIRHEHCFEGGRYGLRLTNLVTHGIDTGDNKLFKIPARRVAGGQRQAIANEATKILRMGVIEPSGSPWSSLPVLVEKRACSDESSSNEFHFCVDYRALNACTKKDVYPFPQIDECLEALAGATWFCVLDLCSGYWQVPLRNEDKEETPFSTPWGHFQFTVMPFGLTNGPGTPERLMELTLNGLDQALCMWYMGDVIIQGRTFDQALDNLQVVLNRLESAGLRLKAKVAAL